MVDRTLRGLVDQRWLRIYGGKRGEGNVHLFDPYTLASIAAGST
jgi:hypothetical protein